jgi:H+/Cl- antiporter ClcA
VSTPKLVVLSVLWILAAAAIGIVVGMVAGELAWIVGWVELGSTAHRTIVDVVALVAFVLLMAVPWLIRRRLLAEPEG